MCNEERSTGGTGEATIPGRGSVEFGRRLGLKTLAATAAVGGLAALTSASAASASSSSSNFIPLAQKGATSGVAALDATGALFTTQSAEASPVTFAVLTPFTAGVAPFSIVQDSAEFSTTWDQVFFLGWNAQVLIGGGVAGQPVLAMGFENDYYDTSYGSQSTMEWYVEYFSPDHTSVVGFRPFACTIARASNSSHGAQVQIDIGSDGTGVFNLLGGASDTFLFNVGPTQAAFAVPLVMSGGNYIELISNAAGSPGVLYNDGTSYWQTVLYHGDHHLYVWDLVNGRFQAKFGAGSTSLSATTEFQSNLQVDGLIFPVMATTAAAPAYVIGGMYFDTTLNKLRVGGASGWETVTSA